ncbi:hypothetical protein PA598K_01362 [Paenibacillus sp. 598K]|nr:hypothetical protein PA598K_01362 [Paenibacillus sp. 598K]
MFFFFFFEEEAIKPGTVCRVKCRFGISPDKLVVVDKQAGGDSYWAYDNRPVRYRINRKGVRVVESDPACIQTIYSAEDLEPTNEIPLQEDGWGAKYRRARLCIK